MTIPIPEKPLILVVDDIPENIHVLANVLKQDCRIKTATNGETALKLAMQGEHPDLILLDVMMPGMSGIEVMRRLRDNQEARDIPVIFVSADALEQSQMDGLTLGADDYLIKPVNPNLLKVRVRNLLERKYSERQLRLAAHVFRHSSEAIMISDKENCIIEVNRAFTELTGYSLDEIKGRNPKMLSAGQTSPEVYLEMWQSIAEKGSWQGELLDRSRDGRDYPKWLSISVVRNAYGDIDFYIASFTDISERKETERHIRHLADHDSLTGLLNRFGLQNRMEQAIATARRKKYMMAALLLDMDRFKQINDTLGHAAGDAMLVEVARRLRDTVRDCDIVARLGGDEFVVILTEVENPTGAIRVAEKILGSLGQTYLFGNNEMYSTPSIGLALFPNDGQDCDMLMKHADTAMYQAKELGRNNIQCFTEGMALAAGERLKMEQDLRQAIEAGQFELYYQPKLDARQGGLLGFEALVRWNHPLDGLVSPGKFIPVAEETGLILALGAWVMDEACRQLRVWRDMGFAELSMAVNLSAHQLRSPTLLTDLVLTLEKHGLAYADLEIEVTESVAMRDPEASIGLLQALRIMGVQLAIDDFGTGYSSLSYLKLLPVHTLKLDQSFVKDVENNPSDASICIATINLAHNLNISVVAEGVETEAQRKFLSEHGCDILQGYLFSKPLPAAKALEFIRDKTNSAD